MLSIAKRLASSSRLVALLLSLLTMSSFVCLPSGLAVEDDVQVEEQSQAVTTEDTWRGVMIDVSRHFQPISFLRRQIEAMSHFGLNRLHLHLTDAAGWRIEVKSMPRLMELAAWRTDSLWQTWWNGNLDHNGRPARLYSLQGSPNAYGGYYTQSEMADLVRFADSLGVQIVPEIEFPAHSEEVTAAYPNLGCTGQPYQCPEFCLGSEETYQFLDSVVAELSHIFTSPYFHIGGDEAGGARWKECPRCQHLMQQQSLTTTHQLQAYAMLRAAEIVRKHGKHPIMWDEAFSLFNQDQSAQQSQPLQRDERNDLPIIMVWRDVSIAEQAIKQGYPVILCPGRWYYLDTYQDAPFGEPLAMGGYTPMQTVWNAPKTKANGHLLGRQVNLWTEYVPTQRHAERMLWPRALAISSWADSLRQNLRSSRRMPSDDDGYRYFRHHVVRQALPWLRKHDIQPFPLEHEKGQRYEYKTPVRSISTHCPVTYLSPYHNAYPAGGDSTLTDGLRGGWTNTDGRWQGFISKGRLDVVVDLQSVRRIRRIETGFMQSLGPEIYLPEHIIISTSVDGNNYLPLYDTTLPLSTQNMDYQTLGWTSISRHRKSHSRLRNIARPSIEARFIRFQALSGARGGWIFADEIMVF